jgi:hypothetical protein
MELISPSELPTVGANGTVADHSFGATEPLDILRSALLATKPSGQPHWPTRLAAVRMLAKLRPEEFERSKEQQRSEPQVVIFDLEPGSMPVLHRARREDEAECVSSQDAQRPPKDASSDLHMFSHETASGESVLIGTWSPLQREESAIITGIFQSTITPRKPNAGARSSLPDGCRPAPRTCRNVIRFARWTVPS